MQAWTVHTKVNKKAKITTKMVIMMMTMMMIVHVHDTAQ